MAKYDSMKISKKLVQDVHRIVNEGAKPLTPKMEQEIEEMADKLANKEGLENVPRANIVRALTNMAKAGDSLEDTEGVEQELHQMHN